MTSPSIDISWSLAEAEAAHAGYSEIGLAHFWVGVCKAVEVSVFELLKAGSPELQAMEGQVEADYLEVREAFSGAGLSPKLMRRAIRAELGCVRASLHDPCTEALRCGRFSNRAQCWPR
jgi:hypothetical protein